MSSDDIEQDAPPTQVEALSVMMMVAQSDDVRKAHSLIVDYCDEADLKGVVDLAWRYQFLDDRIPFKKDIQEIQGNVARKIQMEGSTDK